MSELTHLDDEGRARMVDVAMKAPSHREATARATVRMSEATLAKLREGNTPKGDVLGTARVAGIQAAKQTPALIPLCHGIALTSVEILFEEIDGGVEVRATARCFDRTGVEMEAMTAASVAALTIYDMLKAVERGITIAEVTLLEKRGGRSGHWTKSG